MRNKHPNPHEPRKAYTKMLLLITSGITGIGKIVGKADLAQGVCMCVGAGE